VAINISLLRSEEDSFRVLAAINISLLTERGIKGVSD
jgi:hypothetical protein